MPWKLLQSFLLDSPSGNTFSSASALSFSKMFLLKEITTKDRKTGNNGEKHPAQLHKGRYRLSDFTLVYQTEFWRFTIEKKRRGK